MEHGRLYLPSVFCTMGNFRTACHENRQSPLLYSSSFNSGRFPAYHILDSLWYIGSRCRRFLCCSAPHHEKNAADQRYERSDRRLHQTPFCPCLPLSGASCGTCLSGRTASSGEKRENRNRRICRRMQLLQNRSSLHHRRIFGRYYRNHILPHHRRCLDEPQQPCLGPVQHRLGPGHRPRYLVPLQLPRPLRWIPVCLWYLPRRSLRIHLQCVHRNRIRKSLLGLQRHSLQPRRPYQPPVLFLLGNSRRRLAQKILSCHFALD